MVSIFIWVFYLVPAAAIGYAVVPVKENTADMLFGAFTFSIISGYIFYASGILLMNRKRMGKVSFKHHLPYIVYMIPALIIGYFAVYELIDQRELLLGAYAVSLFFQTVFYATGAVTVRREYAGTGHKYRFMQWLPLYIYESLALVLGAVLVPLMSGKPGYLYTGFFVSVFFAVVTAFAGFFFSLVTLTVKSRAVQLLALLPVFLYAGIAVLLALIVIPDRPEQTLDLFIAYCGSLYGAAMVYYFMLYILYRGGEPESDVQVKPGLN